MAAAFRQHKGYEELLDTGVQWVLLMTLNNSKKETRKLKEKELRFLGLLNFEDCQSHSFSSVCYIKERHDETVKIRD